MPHQDDDIIITVQANGMVPKTGLLLAIQNFLSTFNIRAVFDNEEKAKEEKSIIGGDITSVLIKCKSVVTLYEGNSVKPKVIKNNDDLIPNRDYWLRDKHSKELTTGRCKIYDGWRYIQVGCANAGRFWAHESNSQALDTFDIIGPIPIFPVPDFDKLCK